MKRVVVDTNVLVSAAISPNGSPAKIMDKVSSGELTPFYSREMLSEYERVLAYGKLGIPAQTQKKAIEGIKKLGTLASPATSDMPFADETDRTFYDTAKECGAILITGNLKHYPDGPFVMTPADYLAKPENG